MARMTYDEKVTMRVERAISQHLADALYPQRVPVSIECWKVGGEPVPFETAKHAQYRPFEVGESWGGRHGTHGGSTLQAKCQQNGPECPARGPSLS